MSEKIAMLIASYTSPVSISEILLAMSGRFCVLLRVRVVIIFHAPAARHERTISTRDWSTPFRITVSALLCHFVTKDRT